MPRQTINIDRDLHQRLKTYTKTNGLKLEALATLAITQYLDTAERSQPKISPIDPI